MTAREIAREIARQIRDTARGHELVWRLRLAHPEAYVGPRVVVGGDPGRIHLGPGASIHGPTVLHCSDGGGLTGSRLAIGAGTYVGELNNLRTAGAPIEIGARCLVSQLVTIVGSNHGTLRGTPVVDQPWDGAGVRIGDDVWIGAGCTILPGTVVGDGAVLAANSVVRGEVPAYAVMAGSPARQIGERS